MPSPETSARTGFVLVLIVTCQLMIVLDATVVNVALRITRACDALMP